MTGTQPPTGRAETLALVATSVLWVGSLVALPRYPGPLTLGLAAFVIATPLGLSVLTTQHQGRGLLVYLSVWAGGTVLLVTTAPRDEPALTAVSLIAGLGALAYGLARYGPTPTHHNEEDIA